MLEGQDTNIVFQRGLDSACAIKDMHEPDPTKRYKMGLYTWGSDLPSRGIYILYSPDGIHWIEPAEQPLVAAGDRCSFICDSLSEKYYAMTRVPGQGEMTVGMSEGLSTDAPFTELKLVLKADERGPRNAQFYSMYPFPYGDVYIGYLAMYCVAIQHLDTQ